VTGPVGVGGASSEGGARCHNGPVHFLALLRNTREFVAWRASFNQNQQK